MGLGSAFGGFGKSFNQSTVEAEDRAARQQAAERAQTIETIKLQADIEQMQRAFAEGRIDEGMRLKEQINARQAKIEDLKAPAAKEVLSEADKKAQRAAQEARYKAQGEHEKRMEKHAATQANKPSRFQEELALLKENPDLFRLMQGQSKAGTLTFEEAMKQINSNAATKYLPEDKKAELANEKVKESKIVMGGANLPPVAPPVVDNRSPLQRLMGASSAPTPSAVPFNQLPK
jgi:hypothetical protein